MTKKITIGLICFVLVSCINMNPPQSQAEYIEIHKQYPDSLVNHIPNRLPNNQIGYSFSSKDNKFTNSGICLKTICRSKSEFNEIKTGFFNSIKLNSKDSCIFTIKDKYSEVETLISVENCVNKYPIPQYLYEKTDSFEIYLLGFYSGIFKNEENITENYDYPLNLAHGLSRGISFYESNLEIKYWLIIW